MSYRLLIIIIVSSCIFIPFTSEGCLILCHWFEYVISANVIFKSLMVTIMSLKYIWNNFYRNLACILGNLFPCCRICWKLIFLFCMTLISIESFHWVFCHWLNNNNNNIVHTYTSVLYAKATETIFICLLVLKGSYLHTSHHRSLDRSNRLVIKMKVIANFTRETILN